MRLVWKASLAFPVLAKVADRLLTMHATSCSCERLWSMMRWVYRENRIHLGLEKAKMMMLVAGTERLQQKQAKADFLASEEALVESVFGF